MKRTRLFWVLLSVLLFCNGSLAQGRPNVLILLVDDLGSVDLSSYGSTFHETPNIDALAASGMRFTDAYSASTVCSSTRAALQTGKSPERLKITDWIPGNSEIELTKPITTPAILNELPHSEITLAEAFKDAGYKTFYAGKWHLGAEGYHPDQHGYDINKGGYHAGQPASYYAPYTNPRLKDGLEGEYLTDRLTDETLTFMKEQGDDPFFAMLSFYTVHTPITAAKPYLAYYENKAAKLPDQISNTHMEKNDAMSRIRQDSPEYASMVHALDVNVGRLLDGLDDLGLDKNTIVILTSDNGGLSTLRRLAPTSVKPFRAGKGWVYEGGIRIPLMIRAPGITAAGTESSIPTISMDIAPTLMGLAGIEKHNMETPDGVSLEGILSNESEPDRKAIRVYYPHYHGSYSEPSYMVREGDWKLIYFYERDETELYNLADDIGEQNNLVDDHFDMVTRIKSEMQSWLNSVGAEQPKRK